MSADVDGMAEITRPRLIMISGLTCPETVTYTPERDA